MAKRPERGQDSTQELSGSQLVPDAPLPAAPKRPPARPIGPQNDVSMWKQVVVGTDQFAPAPQGGSSRARRGLVIGLVAVTAIAGGGYALYAMSGGDSPPPASAPSEEAAEPEPAAESAPTPVVAAPIDAAVAAEPPPIDAAPAAVTQTVDAVTSVAPPIIPKKKAATKRRPVKKKAAVKRKTPVKKKTRPAKRRAR